MKSSQPEPKAEVVSKKRGRRKKIIPQDDERDEASSDGEIIYGQEHLINKKNFLRSAKNIKQEK
jgi:hypothetical protein